MTGIIVGASADSVHGIKTAQKMGHYVIAFDGNPDAEGLRHADYAVAADIRDPQVIIKELQLIGQKHHELQAVIPDFIISVPIGRYLTVTGYLADYFNIKGISYKSSVLCTDKYAYHMKLNEYGLRPIECINIPSGTCLDSIDGILIEHIKNLEFPVIIKPRYGSGSRGVSLIKNFDELSEDVVSLLPFQEDYIIENVISGNEYGIDAAVIEGCFQLVLLRKKEITPPPACQCTAYANVIKTEKNKELFSSIESYMQDAVKALDMENCLLHADLMIDDDMKVFAVEISGRPSGHKLHDVFTPLASGVDMVKEFIHYSCNEAYNFIPEAAASKRSLAIRYFDFEACKVIWKPDVKELNKKYDILVYICNIGDEELGCVVDGHSIMDRGYFILSGTDEEDALRQCQEIIDMFVLEKENN